MKHFMSYFKRNVYFMISIITVFLASVFAITMFIVNDISNLAEQTTVGSIYLGVHDESQYESVISTEINRFSTQANYTIVYQGQSYEIPLNLFSFEKDSTMIQIVDDQANKAIFSIDQQQQNLIIDDLELMFTQHVIQLVDVNQLINDIISDMGQMVFLRDYQLSDYFTDQAFQIELNVSTISFVQVNDVDQIDLILDTIEIKSKSRFSILDTLGHLDLTNQQLSVIATNMLKLLTKSHMNGFVFHTYLEPNIWSLEGFNVRILKVNEYDFSFYNPYDFDYQIKIEKTGSTTLSFTLVGPPYVSLYDHDVSLETTIDKEIIYIENTELNSTTPNVIIIETPTHYIYHLLIDEGSDGSIYNVNKVITNPLGQISTIKLYDVLYPSRPMVYEEHVVEKGGA